METAPASELEAKGARANCRGAPRYGERVILGEFLLHQIAHVGVSQRISLKLFGRKIIFEEFQPMRARYRYLNVTDSETDRDRRYRLWQYGNTALCVASRGETPIS